MAGGGQGRITLEKQWRKVLLFIASCYNLNQLSADIKIYNYKIKTRLHIMIVHYCIRKKLDIIRYIIFQCG